MSVVDMYKACILVHNTVSICLLAEAECDGKALDIYMTIIARFKIAATYD